MKVGEAAKQAVPGGDRGWLSSPIHCQPRGGHRHRIMGVTSNRNHDPPQRIGGVVTIVMWGWCSSA